MQQKHFSLVKSMCLTKTFASLLGSQRHLTVAALTKAITKRGEDVYKEGWHSVKQANAALSKEKSRYVLCKAKAVTRRKSFDENEFLQHQGAGLFLIQARCRSTRSKYQTVEHFVGVDFDSGTFVDTLVKERRPINKAEWERIGVVDWQQTFAICNVSKLNIT
jgi:hypothetical protein